MGILGYLLWGLLALLLLLLLAPVVLCAEVRGGEASVFLRVLFLRFPLYPARPPKEKKAKKEHTAQAPAPAAPEAPKKKTRSASEWLELIQQTAEATGAGMRFLCKWMLVYDVEAVIPVNGEDPARLAQYYGYTQAAVGTARAALENLFRHIRYKRLVAVPNFTGDDKIPLVLACKVAVPPVIMIATGGITLVQFLKKSRFFQRIRAVRRAKKRLRARQKQQRRRAG